jgi:hypothetical protein
MITRAKFENFKALRDVEITFDSRLTVLVGPNCSYLDYFPHERLEPEQKAQGCIPKLAFTTQPPSGTSHPSAAHTCVLPKQTRPGAERCG